MQEVRAHVANMKQDGVYVGEDVIVASASCLSHDIYAYISSRKSSPVEYKSSTGASLSQVSVAFYEPDHYRAVMPFAINFERNDSYNPFLFYKKLAGHTC